MNYKYSIIIPARNGGKYLEACVETIVSQNYNDYELIISDDHSTDGTKEYLKQYSHYPNVTILEPEIELSMAEHWEWVLSHASGDWQIFVGQDDGLQPYFFKLADKLTKIADENDIRTIMSSRAYFFWQGCESVYGNKAVIFLAQKKIKIHNCNYEATKALLGIQDYFELPEMYTTSLFSKSILEEVRSKQNGRVFTCHPQDANLAVIAMSLEKRYLKSYIPLGWVGSSVKSAGLAIGSQSSNFQNENAKSLKSLEQEYTQKIKNSNLKYNKLAGDFSFNDIPLYFWQAYLETSLLRTKKINSLLTSNMFKLLFFSSLQTRLWLKRRGKGTELKKIVKLNNCSLAFIKIVAVYMFFIVVFFKISIFPIRILRRFKGMFSNSAVRIFFNRSEHQNLNMRKASEMVLKNMHKVNLDDISL